MDALKFTIPIPGSNVHLSFLAAIILRGIFVAAGAATLQQFHQVLLLFSAILAYSSYKVLFAGDDDDDEVLLPISASDHTGIRYYRL